jgi:hypothetical protein
VQDFKVIIIGSGNQKSNFLARLKSIISTSRVIYLGQLSERELNNAWNKIGVLVSIAPVESYGRVMREALLAFDKQVPGFARPDALMTGVETRTSSPIRIPRGFDFQSVNTAGLFPAGEGAGYAGGILSAGVDGIRVAEALALTLTGQPIPRDMSRGAESSMTYG